MIILRALITFMNSWNKMKGDVQTNNQVLYATAVIISRKR